MRITKKSLAIVLIMTMLLSLMPMTAFGASPSVRKPGQIRKLSIEDKGGNPDKTLNVQIKWSKVKKNVTGYQVYLKKGNGKFKRVATVSKKKNSAIIQAPVGKNTVKVRAINKKKVKKGKYKIAKGKFSVAVTFSVVDSSVYTAADFNAISYYIGRAKVYATRMSENNENWADKSMYMTNSSYLTSLQENAKSCYNNLIQIKYITANRYPKPCTVVTNAATWDELLNQALDLCYEIAYTDKTTIPAGQGPAFSMRANDAIMSVLYCHMEMN